MGKIVGIDLGTTNSALAYVNRIMDRINPMVIVNSEGQFTTPSVVSWDENGDVYVGEIAKASAIINSKTTVSSIKRCMGMADNKKECIKKINNLELIPEQISAIILKKLIRDAENSIGKITNAVISVPAYFRDGERKATIAAAIIAGFKEDQIEIVEEPNAAAMSYVFDNPDIDKEKILVFDLGGGTFDVTILEIQDRICNVKDNGGERLLGGDDFDQRIIDYIIEEFKKEYGIDLRNDSNATQLIKTSAEKAKIMLSNSTSTKIIIRNIIHNKNIEKELTREKFNRLTKDLVEKTKDITNETLDHFGINKNEIDRVIMVGGSSRIPAIQDAVKDIFPGKNMGEGIYLYDPDLAIAKGAAIYASIIFDPKNEEEKNIKKQIVGRVGAGEVVTTHDLGIAAVIEGVSGRFSKIIKKATPRPARNSDEYSTLKDNQTSVDIDVYEGENDIAEKNKLWSKFTVHDIPPKPRGEEKIKVTFEYATNNTLKVIVDIISTGKKTEKFICSQISENELAVRKDEVSTQIKYLK